MTKVIFFALLFASCCPSRHVQYPVASNHLDNSGMDISTSLPVLYAKIDGQVVRYHYSADSIGIYETKYPELAEGLEYIGCGYVYSFNGVIQSDTSRIECFWREKFDSQF